MLGNCAVVGGNREFFRRNCQDKGITIFFYIRLSPITVQVDTKVITHNIILYSEV